VSSSAAAYAEVLTATGSNAAQVHGSAPPPVAYPAPNGVTETAEALIRRWMKVQWQVAATAMTIYK
jgi:hypothetical protein